MAHVMKSTRGAIGGLTRHYERAKTEDGEFLKFGNQEIDTSKSHLNYNLAEHNNNQLDFIKKRTSEVRCLNRKDVNVMCSWVVTVPRSLDDIEEQEKFFKESYNFLVNKYGKENVVSAYVHNDETTPHIHFSFVPVVHDPKKDIYKVSSKELLTRQHLRDFHPQLDLHMQNSFGRNIGILNSATKEGNKSIDELKKGDAMNRLVKMTRMERELESNIEDGQTDLKDIKEQLKIIEVSKADIEKINEITVSSVLFKKDQVSLDKEEFEELLKVAKFNTLVKNELIQPYIELSYQEEKKRNILIKENDELKRDNNKLRDKLNERISLSDISKPAKDKSLLLDKINARDKQIKRLEKFIIDNDLADEFNSSAKVKVNSIDRF